MGNLCLMFFLHISSMFGRNIIYKTMPPMQSMDQVLESVSRQRIPRTTEPIVSNKVTNCSIQLGWILARHGFAINHMGPRPEAKKCDFLIYSVRMDGWLLPVFFDDDFFRPVQPIEMKLKTYHYFNKMKPWLVFCIPYISPQTLVLNFSTFIIFSKYLENDDQFWWN